MSTPSATLPDVSPLPEAVELEKQYLLQSYARYPVLLRRGKGCYVYDANGRRYLDLISGIGVNALGYAHPRITKVICEQAAKLIHTSNLFYHDYQGPLAQKLAAASGLQRTFFTNSGTESMEGAIKMMHAHGRKLSPEKYEIISLDNSFHGRSTGALALTGQDKYRAPFEPLMPGVRFIPTNDVAALEAAFNERTAGIVVEGIQGEGGIHPISAEFLRRSRELADRYDALLCLDDIQSGVGRPGTYFSYQLFDPVVLPDICVLAKPIGCGMPLGAILTNERAAASIGPGMHGSTFGGNALACRVALEFFELLDDLLPSITRVGAYFRMRMSELARKHTLIRDVRGVGLMIGVELDQPCKHLVPEGICEGLLFNVTHDTVMRFLPPYILTEQEVDRGVAIVDKLLARFKPAA